MNQVWAALIGATAGLALLWLSLILILIVRRPRGLNAAEALRLLPDTVVLIRRLAADPALPRGIRIRLFLLLGYLILPIDLIPDFIPVIGYADDAVIVTLALRSVSRRAGPDALDKHWPGTATGLQAIKQLAGIGPSTKAEPG